MSKTHFLTAVEPLDFSRDLPRTALCGKIIAHPVPESSWEPGSVVEFNSLRDCRKCMSQVVAQNTERLCVYGMVEGQEAEKE